MKIIALTIQVHTTSSKLVTPNISWWKETLSKDIGFPENPAALTFLNKYPHKRHYLVQPCFCDPTIWKATTTAIQNTLTFDQNSFNSRSNMHVNFVFWIPLQPKKRAFTYFPDSFLRFCTVWWFSDSLNFPIDLKSFQTALQVSIQYK